MPKGEQENESRVMDELNAVETNQGSSSCVPTKGGLQHFESHLDRKRILKLLKHHCFPPPSDPFRATMLVLSITAVIPTARPRSGWSRESWP